jgi:hypothetical protein
VFVGFAPTYYLVGVFEAPLPNPLVHVHGAVSSCWILLLMVQTSLVAGGRVDVHRRLGMLGFGIACLVVIVGVMTAVDSQVRHFIPGEAGIKGRARFMVPLTAIITFATLIWFAFRRRLDSAAHKRLILIATIVILDAAFQRWPVPVKWWGHLSASLLCTIPLLLLTMGYDCWSRGTVHRATLWASGLVIVLQQLRDPIGYSSLFQRFATWVGETMTSV